MRIKYAKIACISDVVDGRNEVISERMCYYIFFEIDLSDFNFVNSTPQSTLGVVFGLYSWIPSI